MGRRLIALAAADADIAVVGAMESSGHHETGRDAGDLAGLGPIGVPISDEPPDSFDVLLEFSIAAATQKWVDICYERRRPIVIGTTGHDERQVAGFGAASKVIPVLRAANMSVGVNVLLRLVRQLGATLDESYDVEIVETHHRHKVDAPSGTALALRDAIDAGRTEAGRGGSKTTFGRRGAVGARPTGEIGVHAVRMGDIVGEHVVRFGAAGETVSIQHAAHSRDTFAAGALRAARWIAGKPAGLYGMDDVLFGGANRRR
jgi:4-hydroxy-tetrahydrodipicolinate reductase